MTLFSLVLSHVLFTSPHSPPALFSRPRRNTSLADGSASSRRKLVDTLYRVALLHGGYIPLHSWSFLPSFLSYVRHTYFKHVLAGLVRSQVNGSSIEFLSVGKYWRYRVKNCVFLQFTAIPPSLTSL